MVDEVEAKEIAVRRISLHGVFQFLWDRCFSLWFLRLKASR